ncbi:MAG: hypothetical protein QF893_09310 [Alphaproteobacteria bacterium]|jgi:hypothetical protein|nr:hypothetical protein [Alphaproteobacteria bacterium]
MSDPGPTTHLYRLGFLIVVAGAVFLGLVVLLSPTSWHYDMGYWHRAAALDEMAQQPLVYGGITSLSPSRRNAGCKSCHKDVTKEVRKLKHKQVSCEACHGALADHVREGKKVAEAKIDKSTAECLICHENFINKPASFPQFKTAEKFNKHRSFIAGEFKPGTTCFKCHDAHDPTP